MTIPRIDGKTDWSQALAGVDNVVHLAARVHVMRDDSDDPLRDFREVNTEGTANLAEQAASAGVRRFVYMSSIKVNGESTDGTAFSESDVPNPDDPYAVSKWEAEQRLLEVAARTDLEVVIIRPPLVYGSGVKGNILRLLRWVQLGIPLPFANVENRRSLIGLDNLVDFVLCCLDHPNAPGETFLVSDGRDLSTAELVCGLAQGMGKQSRLVPIPKRLVHRLLKMAGKEALWRRLWGDLQVDASKARELLDWRAPTSIEQGLAQVGAWYGDSQAASRIV